MLQHFSQITKHLFSIKVNNFFLANLFNFMKMLDGNNEATIIQKTLTIFVKSNRNKAITTSQASQLLDQKTDLFLQQNQDRGGVVEPAALL